jgi:hypothetical protein
MLNMFHNRQTTESHNFQKIKVFEMGIILEKSWVRLHLSIN